MTVDKHNILLTNFVCEVKYTLNVSQVDGVYHYVQVPAEYFSVPIVIRQPLGMANLFICDSTEFGSSSFRTLFASTGQYKREAIAI